MRNTRSQSHERPPTGELLLGFFACPNPDCEAFNRFGGDTLSVAEQMGKDKAIRRLHCRNCTTAQNNANRRYSPNASSQYLGVSRDTRRRKWVAHIKDRRKERYLGSFDMEQDAARAYDRTAVTVHGPYANLNFPEEVIRIRENSCAPVTIGYCQHLTSDARTMMFDLSHGMDTAHEFIRIRLTRDL